MSHNWRSAENYIFAGVRLRVRLSFDPLQLAPNNRVFQWVEQEPDHIPTPNAHFDKLLHIKEKSTQMSTQKRSDSYLQRVH